MVEPEVEEEPEEQVPDTLAKFTVQGVVSIVVSSFRMRDTDNDSISKYEWTLAGWNNMLGTVIYRQCRSAKPCRIL